jgi:hypothetical protein
MIPFSRPVAEILMKLSGVHPLPSVTKLKGQQEGGIAF